MDIKAILSYATAAAKSLQLCLTLWDPIDGSSPGSAVPGILQARTLEWVAISFKAWKWKVKVKSLSRVWLLATPWTIAHQAPPSMGFSTIWTYYFPNPCQPCQLFFSALCLARFPLSWSLTRPSPRAQRQRLCFLDPRWPVVTCILHSGALIRARMGRCQGHH